MQKTVRQNCVGPERQSSLDTNNFTFEHLSDNILQNEVPNQSLCTGQQINVAKTMHMSLFHHCVKPVMH